MVKAVWRVWEGCLEGVGRLPGQFGRLSWGCGEAVCWMWGGCLACVGRWWRGYQGDLGKLSGAMLSVGCVEAVSRVCEGCPEGVRRLS